MVAAQPLRPLTIEDLAEQPDDGFRHEILLGELVVSPAPSPVHQMIVGELYRLIADYLDETNAGVVLLSPVDVQLSVHNVVEPDIVFVEAGSEDLIGPGHVTGVPNIVVEVLSPSSRRLDGVRKMALYADSGVPEYWIVDGDGRSLSVYVLEGGHYQLFEADGVRIRSRELSGFGFIIENLFARVERCLGKRT